MKQYYLCQYIKPYFQDKTLCLSGNQDLSLHACMKVIRTFNPQPVKTFILRARWQVNKHGDTIFQFIAFF